MSRLELDDRSFEDTDGTWTRITVSYNHPWENDAPADIWVSVRTFARKEGVGFDFASPDNEIAFAMGEMEAVMLHGFLGAASTLMPRQWAQYCAQKAKDKADE